MGPAVALQLYEVEPRSQTESKQNKSTRTHPPKVIVHDRDKVEDVGEA